MKILSYGISIDRNFGGPSLLSGLNEGLLSLYGKEGFSLVHYQRNSPEKQNLIYADVDIRECPYVGIGIYFDWIKCYLMGRKSKSEARDLFWNEFRSSDAVLNIYGICFCSKLGGGKTRGFLTEIKSSLCSFSINLVARLSGKLSLKSASSYGPISSFSHRIAARIAMSLMFDRMLAREIASAEQLGFKWEKEWRIPVAPDMANLMPVPYRRALTPQIGISISFQIIKQWGGDTKGYVQCIKQLIQHIYSRIGVRIVLIPNELKPEGGYDDISVANEILSAFGPEYDISIFQCSQLSPLELKECIASCEVMVASRYHSCVASLSAGVPVFVIGWHYKYKELMDLYGQGKWMISTEDCISENLVSYFDSFWDKREESRREIGRRLNEVRNSVLGSLKYLFGKE